MPMPLSRRHLLKNLSVLAGGSVVVRLVSVATTLVVTRALGPTGFGVLSSGLAVATVVGVCANLGLEDYVTRQVARAPERAAEALSEALVARLVALPVAALAALALALAFPRAALVFVCLIAYSLLHSYLLLVCAAFRGLQRMEAQSMLLGTQIVLIAGGAVGATALTHDPLPVAAAYLLATAATLGLTAWLLRRVGIHVRYSRRGPLRRILRASAPFGLTAVGVVVYDRVGAVAVLALCGASAAGWFNAAYGLVLALTSLPSVAVAALYPSLAATAQSDRRALATVSRRLVGSALAGGLLLALCLDLGGAHAGGAAVRRRLPGRRGHPDSAGLEPSTLVYDDCAGGHPRGRRLPARLRWRGGPGACRRRASQPGRHLAVGPPGRHGRLRSWPTPPWRPC